MKKVTATVFDVLSNFRNYFQEAETVADSNEAPFSSELYSSEKMNKHGIRIARTHILAARNKNKDQLLSRLDDNEIALLEVRRILVDNIRLGKVITPGAEWLLDNFYLIEQQIVLARKHFPKGYSQELPHLENGVAPFRPRVYNIVLEIISHSDGRVDVKSLSSFITAYQSVTVLTIGELWAIPIMLRLAVIENLRRVCRRIALDMVDANFAEYWVERVINTVKQDPGDLVLTISDMARSKPMLSNTFVSTFTRHLRGEGPLLTLPLTWMEQQLARIGADSADMVRQENQKQAADQVSVRNSIGTLRFIGATDWRDFIEALSSIEHVLRLDPAGTYPKMDFATRDQYRHVIESIARQSQMSETQVAQAALDLARTNKQRLKHANKHRHIGYYLVDSGKQQLELYAGVKNSLKQRLRNSLIARPFITYFLAIAALAALPLTQLYPLIINNYTGGYTVLALACLALVSAAAQLAISVVNWLSTILVRPGVMPRMDFSEGIPGDCRTLVAVPAMLTGKDHIEMLAESLEIRYLANNDKNLFYCLLTDFPDADSEDVETDHELLATAIEQIQQLNTKYARDGETIFFLFHRPRKWNDAERKWMGYERKRGKLSALNALLRGSGTQQFSFVSEDYEKLTGTRYVITLDSDTQLPRDSAWKLVATIAHPLNKGVYDPEKKRVTEGYGILQPRLDTTIAHPHSSLYLRMQGDMAGIDPYTLASSDVYQDIFGEGSFIGKGIYDVDIFEQAVAGVFPENRILSHDLVEGCYARAGLVSDVYLYEHNPAEYTSNIKRHERWIRGDWQIGTWMLPVTLAGNRRFVKNKLSALSRWKIFDNLRRSLLPLSLLLLLVLGWLFLPIPWLWTAIVMLVLLAPALLSVVWQLANKPSELSFAAHLNEVKAAARDALIRFVFSVATLPYEAYVYTAAVIRTGWRMLVSKTKLLEWTPSGGTSSDSNRGVWYYYRALWPAPALGLLVAVLMLGTGITFFLAIPVLILWLLAPASAWKLSELKPETDEVLPGYQIAFLHKTARKTWGYFEAFVTEADNWLPPDNFQEHPGPIIAHRTSPTNMGLALLANVTAWDFNYISGGRMLERCANTMRSMQALERHKGHFYNWYDTETLAPLKPKYVSSVDSGNLAGHLLTLRQALLGLCDQPILGSRIYEGLKVTVEIIRDVATDAQAAKATRILDRIEVAERDMPITLISAAMHLQALELLTDELAATLPPPPGQLPDWTQRLLSQIRDLRSDTVTLAPWATVMPSDIRDAGLAFLSEIPTLSDLAYHSEVYLEQIDRPGEQPLSISGTEYRAQIRAGIISGSAEARKRMDLLESIADQCEQLSQVEYDFLYDTPTGLLRIGYNVDEQRKDNSFYDLLASEARLGLFVGIAQGELPQESWFTLGRLLTKSSDGPILLSWSGSMFEYLMPQLVMPSYNNTLLQQTSVATVKRQIEYGAQRGTPWGISESAYNGFDTQLNYQYRAFGVPGLGLKRGLEDDLVIAPYATMLALMVLPGKACDNLQLLAEHGMEGEFGFYEAVDYTKTRLPRNQEQAIIKSYMAHHQGMGLLSIAYYLLNKPMQQRFVRDPRVQATLLLLQERIPRATTFYAHTAELAKKASISADVPVRHIYTPMTETPQVQLLGNAHYRVMITNSGGGYSRWKDIAVSRWREDTTRDNYGSFCYIKDIQTNNVWSNTYQPTLSTTGNYEAIFSPGHAEFRRYDHGIETKTEIIVSPEDDTEVRRIRITNKTSAARQFDITSYTEVVLAPQSSDEAHPAFSNLFVQTEILKEYKAILCTRRARSADETPPWMLHMMNVHGTRAEHVSYETDRMKFVGRNRNLANPVAMASHALSNSEGAVLDPIAAIRSRITVKPGQTVIVDLIYSAAETRGICEALLYKYLDHHLKNRAFEMSWTHSQVLLRQISATDADAQLYDRLASSIIYADPAFRGDASVVMANARGQSELWSHTVSGDLPIVLLHMFDPKHFDLVKQMVQAHTYWRLKGLNVDLVIWNEDYGSYRQLLQEQITALVSSLGTVQANNHAGRIFVRSADQVSSEDRLLFESVARVILSDKRGTLSEQINILKPRKVIPALLEPTPFMQDAGGKAIAFPSDLLFYNEMGGFTRDGTEYKIKNDYLKTTPAPWVNVLANSNFGSVVSDGGSAYTWAVNAHEYRLTPWNNDPVTDAGGEAFYIRDEDSGHFWSPMPYPAIGLSQYITTHGFGYSTFEHTEQGIHTETTTFVDKELPVKFVVIKVRNESGRARNLSVTGFMEMILGDVRAKTNMHVISEYDEPTGTLLFRNRYNTIFSDRVTFFRVNANGKHSFTTDRAEFIGRNRNLSDPQALRHKKLMGSTGACMDACAAMQLKFELEDETEKELVFQLGSEENIHAAQLLIAKLRQEDCAENSLRDVREYWREALGAVQVSTPDNALNLLANGWLTYQNLACRLFARSGFYQSGGAFGFRDQLQDVLALLHTKPELARKQILLHASRQFIEGDVQHWWHPPEGRGVRTKCSDDLLWLPFAASRYINTTGDAEILSIPVGYLDGHKIPEGDDSLYELPETTNTRGTLYEHCVHAITHCLNYGKHGLPFIGSGDWNDGMDKVGNKGRGESVWLGFFLYDILLKFSAVAAAQEDIVFSGTCMKEAAQLKANIEKWGWDGDWYKRAFFDDGSPLGSKDNTECRIDAIAQSWAVLSGAASETRAKTAMNSLDRYLVNRELNLIHLLTPPFESGETNPGYIKGYVAGVRENGGQYSHAAIWALMAFAALNEREKVWELFSMIHPIGHTMTAAGVQTYKTEPYVMAADVYANEQHGGRGGWTWYTGSAGWMYQFIIESLLGLRLATDKLLFNPCFPLHWPSVSVTYRFKSSTYHIEIFQREKDTPPYWKMDERQGEGNELQLADDGLTHKAVVYV